MAVYSLVVFKGCVFYLSFLCICNIEVWLNIVIIKKTFCFFSGLTACFFDKQATNLHRCVTCVHIISWDGLMV